MADTPEKKDKSSKSRTAARWIGAGLLGVVPFYLLAVRPWHIRWGATDEEVARAMPGDDICPSPHLDSTRAVSVNATPEQIWPWLLQLGRGRAGWYSYDFIDNGGHHSSEAILPEWQNLQAGDFIPTGIGKGFKVMLAEPNRFLVLQLGSRASCTLGLYPTGEAETRLVSRVRMRWNLRSPKEAVTAAVVDPGDFVMMRKMMLGIKRRAEAYAREQEPVAPQP